MSTADKIQSSILGVLSITLVVIIYQLCTIIDFTDTGDKIQLGVLIVLLITLGFIGFQVRLIRLATRVTTNTERVNLFLPILGARITQEDVEMMHFQLADRIHVSTYYKYYHDHPKRIMSYLLMERKYIYILYALDIDKGVKRHLASGAAEKWLADLCQYYEFRHVHESQRHYYPKEFTELVDRCIGRTKLVGWMLDTKEKP